MVEVIYHPRLVCVEIKRDGVGEIEHCLSEGEPTVVFSNGLVFRWVAGSWYEEKNPRGIKVVRSDTPYCVAFNSLHGLWVVVGTKESI